MKILSIVRMEDGVTKAIVLGSVRSNHYGTRAIQVGFKLAKPIEDGIGHDKRHVSSHSFADSDSGLGFLAVATIKSDTG